jgi:hypothetical protein
MPLICRVASSVIALDQEAKDRHSDDDDTSSIKSSHSNIDTMSKQHDQAFEGVANGYLSGVSSDMSTAHSDNDTARIGRNSHLHAFGKCQICKLHSSFPISNTFMRLLCGN